MYQRKSEADLACEACCNLIFWSYFWYNFTYLYYGNPDDTECFADIKSGKVDNMEANSSMTDVSGQFKSWVFAGFIIYTVAPFFIISGKILEVAAQDRIG